MKPGDKIQHKEKSRRDNGERVVLAFSSNGQVVYDHFPTHRLVRRAEVCFNDASLFEVVPVKKEGWVNVYPHACNTGIGAGVTIWSTKNEADEKADSSRVACVRIEWEEPAS